MFGRMVDCEAAPELICLLWAEKARERTASVRAQIVENQVNRSRAGISLGKALKHPGELCARTVGCGPSKVATGQRLDGAEDIGRATALVFVIAFGGLTRLRLYRGA